MSRVLVVHSDAALGARLGAALSAAGLEVRAVTSGERAMDRFIQEPADVVVIDYHLDGRDGIATAEAIRWMPGGRRARVVLLAEQDPETRPLAELGRTVDAFAVLVAPMDPARVRAIVERAVAARPPEPETRVVAGAEMVLHLPDGSAGPAARWEEPTAPTAEMPLADVAVALSRSFALGAHDEQTLDEPAPPAWEVADPDGLTEAGEVRRLADAAASGEGETLDASAHLLGVLRELSARRACGTLVAVRAGDDRPTLDGRPSTKAVQFRAGVPVHVRSNLAHETLAYALARQGKVTEEDVRQALAASRRSGARQEDVLISRGAIGALDLADALAEQLRQKLFELFAWTSATFSFLPEEAPAGELLELDMGLAEIAFRGVRYALPPERALAAATPNSELFAIPSARAMVRFARLPMPDTLRDVLRRVDGRRTVRELLARAREPGRAAQLLEAMACLGAVRLEASPVASAARTGVAPTARTGVAPAARTGVAPAARTGIAPAARTGVALVGDAPSPRVSVIAARPTEERAAANLPSLPEAAVLAESEAGASLGWSPAADWGQEPTPVELAHEGGARAAAAGSKAAGDESAVRVAPPREGWDPEAASEAPRAEAAASAPSARASSQLLDDRVDRLLAAERHVRRAQRALDRGRPDEAEAALEKALQLCPDEPRFVALAAWARYAASPDDAFVLGASLSEAARACALAPELALAHVLSARLLEAAGRPDEAREAYRRAHAIDPLDDEAKQKA